MQDEKTVTRHESDWIQRAAKFLRELPPPLAWLSSNSQSEPEQPPLEFGDCHPTLQIEKPSNRPL